MPLYMAIILIALVAAVCFMAGLRGAETWHKWDHARRQRRLDAQLDWATSVYDDYDEDDWS
jgi:hypothetical protein